MTNKTELLSFFKQRVVEAGCDEAGRGCLAGPVIAAAVILPENFTHPLLNDSKKINEKNRYLLREEIEACAISYAIGIIDNRGIDKINILRASIMAMHKALDSLKMLPDHIIIDGNKFTKYKNIPHQCIVKGDSKYYSIAAASILAKTYRDDIMNDLHQIHPEYNWKRNKGYPTKEHRQAIKNFGTTPFHRLSFRLLDEQLSLNL